MKKKPNLLPQYNPILYENENKANIVIDGILIVLSSIYILIGILFALNIFKASSYSWIILIALGSLFLFLSLLGIKHKTFNIGIKYIKIIFIFVSIFLINILMGYKLWLLYSLPILLSIRYYNKKFTLCIDLIAVFFTIASSITNAYLSKYTGLIDLNLVSFNTPGELSYYSWLYNAVLQHGYDANQILINGIKLSVIPNSIIIGLIGLTANSIITNALSLFNQIYIDYEKELSLLRQARTDSLTGLLNRRAYDEDISNFTEESFFDMVYISMDLNGLKRANDNLGHKAGDELIIATAECINKTFKEYGKTYRIGGDEFAAIIYLDENNLDRIKQEFENNVRNWKGEYNNSLSVSCGYVISTENEKPLSIDEIEKLADKKMYENKEKYYRDNKTI